MESLTLTNQESLCERLVSVALALASSYNVTFSGGVAWYPQDGTDIDLLYHAADMALYRAKKGGRHRLAFTSSSELYPLGTN